MNRPNSDFQPSDLKPSVGMIVIAVFLLLLLVGGIGHSWLVATTAGVSLSEPVEGQTALSGYPRAWQDAGLPRIPDSQLVSPPGFVGNGCQFELVTSLSVDEVGSFLETELAKRNWDYYENGNGGDPQYANDFIKNHTEVTVGVDPCQVDPGRARITVAIRACVPRRAAPTGLTASSSRVMAD